MAERWLPVVGYNGLYEVSDLGRVRSHARGAPRLLKPGPSGKGYLTVSLWRFGKGQTNYVHILVARAFIGPPPEGHEVRHLNGILANCRFDNLVYGTQSENNEDRKWHAGHRCHKLTPVEVREIKNALGPHGAGRALARQYGVHEGTVSKIKVGRIHMDVAA